MIVLLVILAKGWEKPQTRAVSIRVRDKWREVRTARDPKTLNQFSPATIALLKHDVAPLMQWRDVRGDAPAFDFDLLVTRLEQQRLTGSADFANGSAEIRNVLSNHLIRTVTHHACPY
jgi:type I restriction enzyme, R subunit